MKKLTVTYMKTHLDKIIPEVMNGEEFEITADKSNEPVAMIVPVRSRNKTRKIGVLDGKAFFRINGDGKISEEEFLGL